MNIKVDRMDDLHLLSCFLQGSITSQLWFKQNQQTLKILINRFCPEEGVKRCNAILQINHVVSLWKNFENDNSFKVIIAMIMQDSDKILITCSDGCKFLIKVLDISLAVSDISHKWFGKSLDILYN